MGACGADCGITRVREREKEAARALAARLHPGMVWRPIAVPLAAVPFDARVALARHMEDVLPVRAIVRVGEPGRGDAVDLLAGVHAPSLAEIADGDALRDDAPAPSMETYLRVTFSPFGRLVALREVQMEAREGAAGLAIIEAPQAGVVDRRLRDLVKGLQGALRKAGLTLLDMAFLMAPLEVEGQAAFVGTFHEAPTLWSLLFDPEPPTTVRTSVARPARADQSLRVRR